MRPSEHLSPTVVEIRLLVRYLPALMMGLVETAESGPGEGGREGVM